jgi:hypothetical protein
MLPRNDIVIVEQTVREVALFQKKPDALDGIELGTIGRHQHERDAGGHRQFLGRFKPLARPTGGMSVLWLIDAHASSHPVG